MKPLSLYIHIPFCNKKCSYCDFLSFEGNNDLKEQYTKALIKEIKAYCDKLKDYEIDTIFIGGGTPSTLSINLMEQIFKEIKKLNVSENAEISIEVNPGTVSEDKLLAYRVMGINRLSIGLQSVENKLLKTIGRIHNYNTFLDTYQLARKIGFDNINIDLMFALPNQTLEDWQNTIEKIVQLNPEHISSYSLIVEEGTPFSDLYEEGKYKLLDEELERKMYHYIINRLEQVGYNHYEISNFAKNNLECRHNTTYWVGTEYLGLGLGASSYMKGTRYSNCTNINRYITSSTHLVSIQENINKLSKKEKMEEFIFLGLRLNRGISIDEFQKRFDKSIYQIYESQLKQLKNECLIEIKNNIIKLTQKGIDLSNYVFSKFL